MYVSKYELEGYGLSGIMIVCRKVLVLDAAIYSAASMWGQHFPNRSIELQ
jgi:hypothetical protein